MNFNIRQAVLSKLNNAGYDNVYATISDAINIQEEKVLPGLGVLFELYWKSTNQDEKNNVVHTIVNSLKS